MHNIYHPNAWLTRFRNIKPGLTRRTKILIMLEQGALTAKLLTEKLGVTYSTTLHHLHLLENRRIIVRTSFKPPYLWKVNLLGQQVLNKYLS